VYIYITISMLKNNMINIFNFSFKTHIYKTTYVPTFARRKIIMIVDKETNLEVLEMIFLGDLAIQFFNYAAVMRMKIMIEEGKVKYVLVVPNLHRLS
jgi:hypothetical protein